MYIIIDIIEAESNAVHHDGLTSSITMNLCSQLRIFLLVEGRRCGAIWELTPRLWVFLVIFLGIFSGQVKMFVSFHADEFKTVSAYSGTGL